ncbi:MAG: DUF721 domain-containing protein [bacterium]|nr:DUF721 domain-containing protein [bacterium]
MALRRWQPPGPASPDHAIASNWERIVGHGVAANARPREVREGALTVLVPSAAWRAELAFHAPAIVAALQRLPEVGAAVQRLRLRLGRSAPPARRVLAAADQPAARGGRRERVPEAPAADLPSALSRLRERVARLAAQERRNGREPCGQCGSFVPRGGRCTLCTRQQAAAVECATQRALFESPWIGYEGTAALIPGLEFAVYARLRARTLERWWQMLLRMQRHRVVSRDGRERKVAQSYVALKSGSAPERLTPLVVREMLGAEIYDLLWGVHDAK